MNPKLRSILHTTWNEPRHFFFWLAMLSLTALMVLVLAVSLGLASDVGPAVFLIGFGFVVCFVMSILAFVLTWIPPVRRLVSWLFRRRFFTLASLITLVALFYAIENWRGWRAWHNYKQQREAQGERFELASLVPPPVPEDQNLFETPLWNDLHFVQRTNRSGRRDQDGSGVIWSDTNWGKHVLFDPFGPKDSGDREMNFWLRTQRVDLVAWQALYRGSNNVFTANDGSTTNYFPIAKEAQTPAADVLLALSRFERNRQMLIAASARPHARFWINYDAGFAAVLPHLAPMKFGTKYLGLHAEAARESGNNRLALEDLELSLRLIEAIRSEPILISQFVRASMLEITLQPVWQGLADRQWTEAELKTIESEFGKLDFLADYHVSMRGERGFNLWLTDYIRETGGLEAFELLTMVNEVQHSGAWRTVLATGLLHLAPRGWFDQNKLSLCKMHEIYLLPLVDQTNRVVRPLATQESQRVLKNRRLRPYDALSRFLLPAVTSAPNRLARAQTMVDLCRVACALERYRLAKGQFPESLQVLAPEFIDELPHDIINGQPLNYRRTDDGQFILFSVGWNEPGEARRFELAKDHAWYKGPWVWQYPAK